VPEEQHACAAGKFEGILDARENTVALRSSEQPGPLIIRSDGKRINVSGSTGPPEDRRSDAVDDHCGDACPLQPLREISESGNEEPRNPFCHGNA
jgi:hypothetical protein